MNKHDLVNFLINFFYCELLYGCNKEALANDLADELETNGYCSSPYEEYRKALICPINKRREKYCGCTQCESHEFCELLRKEGYINV